MSQYVYTRHKLTRYTRHFLTRASKAYGVFSEYDFGFAAQYVFGRTFQHHLNTKRATSHLTFSDHELQEIVRRCRVLRSFAYDQAVDFIAAAEATIDHFIETARPTLVVAPRIDTYLLDILERKLHRNGARYLGVWRSAFQPNKFFLTNRGEIHPINDPTDDECAAFLSGVGDMRFKATSLSDTSFSNARLLLNHGQRLSRDVALEVIRRCGPLRVGYRELATGFHVEDYRCPPSTWFGHITTDEDMRALLRSGGKKIFIALQVNPESTIDYYCKHIELIDIAVTLKACVEAFVSQGFTVIMKDHPNMFGKRNFASINPLLTRDRVFLAGYGMTSNEILASCDAVFTWSGTVAVQAYLNAIPCITVCSPFAIDAPGFFRAESLTQVHAAARALAIGQHGTVITDANKRHLVRHILRTHQHGSVFTHDRVPADATAFAAWVEASVT